jgi:hypothetical protein
VPRDCAMHNHRGSTLNVLTSNLASVGLGVASQSDARRAGVIAWGFLLWSDPVRSNPSESNPRFLDVCGVARRVFEPRVVYGYGGGLNAAHRASYAGF